MNPTGPTKEATRDLVIALEKHAKASKQGVWLDIASRLGGRRRGQASVNLYKLSALAEKHKGEILVVPGKVLADGSLATAAEIAAESFSAPARKKIAEGKGKALSLLELMARKPKAAELRIVG